MTQNATMQFVHKQCLVCVFTLFLCIVYFQLSINLCKEQDRLLLFVINLKVKKLHGADNSNNDAFVCTILKKEENDNQSKVGEKLP